MSSVHVLDDVVDVVVQPDKSSEFMKIITNKLLPIITTIFSSYVKTESDSFTKPTSYLNTQLKVEPKSHDLQILQNEFNTIYEIDIIQGSDNKIIITLNDKCFTLSIVPLNNVENTIENNNFAISPYNKLNMYIYGVKANGSSGPKISGNALNNAALRIFNAMHIPQIYIYQIVQVLNVIGMSQLNCIIFQF